MEMNTQCLKTRAMLGWCFLYKSIGGKYSKSHISISTIKPQKSLKSEKWKDESAQINTIQPVQMPNQRTSNQGQPFSSRK
jgi:hypothetical protein